MLLTMRHEARYAKMREIVQSGAIGDVCQISCENPTGWKTGRIGSNIASA